MILDEPQPLAPSPTDMGNTTDTPNTMSDSTSEEKSTTKKSFGFYAIIVALALRNLLTSLEATITSTALPSITADLGGGFLFVWVVNDYYLTQTAFQPFVGQMADIYGRRWPMLISVSIFTIGSGVAGGSKNIETLIAGRLLQGIGAGGILVLTEIIICDILPLRERGKYLGFIVSLVGVGAALGPVFGGLIVEYSTWPWVFYLNIPVGGVAVIFLYIFLRLNYDRTPNYLQRIWRFDWLGNILFVLSMISILTAFSWASTQYPWNSYQVLVPLILGFAGGAGFVLYEASPFCVSPAMLLHIFANRTSGTGFAITFLHTLSSISVMYFLPVYFQATLNASPSRAGVMLLPTILFLVPGAIIGGTVLSKFGRYRPIQHAGLALMVIGFGLLSLLDANSNTGQRERTGLVLSVLLPAVQAPLTDQNTALCTATWSFMWTFGFIWGATVSTALFNNRYDVLIKKGRITDSILAAQLTNGRAYEHATKRFIDSIEDLNSVAEVRSEEIKLRKELNTKFALEEKEKMKKSEA
ncbi:major facilitator superfamily domain-containing protein [Podospora fimiseda]|uniref:Major facilitator superfamily domain-containing protein n=1 Tax=Podospora fimiseda TaxID=252190 RepID=A0AAN7BSA2_9PEZI|nr:major facilitator superfamily domain-containing protein [Podospora fimiseda]